MLLFLPVIPLDDDSLSSPSSLTRVLYRSKITRSNLYCGNRSLISRMHSHSYFSVGSGFFTGVVRPSSSFTDSALYGIRGRRSLSYDRSSSSSGEVEVLADIDL